LTKLLAIAAACILSKLAPHIFWLTSSSQFVDSVPIAAHPML